MNERIFRVEGHGRGTLISCGGGADAFNVSEPYLTRAEAWDVVKKYRARRDLHTIRVRKNSECVYSEYVRDGKLVSVERS